MPSILIFMADYHIERQRVLDACLTLAGKGYIPGTGGNVALRVSPEHVAVTPTASDYYSMKAEDICVLRLDTLAQIAGDKKPSVESGIHARFLRFRQDFAASIHTHQPIASAFSLLNRELRLSDDDGATRAALGPVIPIVRYAPSGTTLLARAFERCLRADCAAYLLRNHGVVCGGATMDAAIQNVALVERAASDALRSLIAGRDRARLGKDVSLVDHALTALE